MTAQVDLATVIDIGDQKQLFIDDALIDSQECITRTFHPFKRHSDAPILIPEKSWERPYILYVTVLRDKDGLMRMWYTNHGPLQPPGHEDHTQVCYATSYDGLHWERPSLGIIEVNGSTQNNVLARAYKKSFYHRAGSVVYNPKEPDPARRYVHLSQRPDGSCPSYSADGLHWAVDDQPIFQPSDAATLSYDPRQDRYFCSSVSDVDARGFVRRSIEITETDLKSWRDFQTVLVADEIDDAGAPDRIGRLRSILDYDNPEHYHTELHHMVAFPYASYTLGIVTVWDTTWHTQSTPLFAGGKDRAIVHMQMTWTRDADWLDWNRLDPREPVLELSEPGDWDCAWQLPPHAPVQVGDELWLYYVGSAALLCAPRTHGFGLPDRGQVPPNGVGVAKLRLDGFVSLDASPRGGTFLTKPLTFSGSKLFLNGRGLGQITVEILDVNGEPIDGIERQTVTGDSVRHEMYWCNLGAYAGRPVCLRVRMWNAQLYAFAFGE